MVMNIPLGSGPSPPVSHTTTTSNGMWGPSAAVGSIRFNTTISAMEMWDGTQWVLVTAKSNPQNWREWFKHYINTSGSIPDRYTKQVYIQQEMQGRFPGRYCVDLAGDTWAMVFDCPEDETWFHLKYE